jgi:hypothetical protein
LILSPGLDTWLGFTAGVGQVDIFSRFFPKGGLTLQPKTYFMKKELIHELFEKFEQACYVYKGVECWSARANAE